MTSDPIYHGYWSDGLPEDHPKAYETLYCISCKAMVHAANNELMRDWFETGRGPTCLDCFFFLNAEGDPAEDWGLPVIVYCATCQHGKANHPPHMGDQCVYANCTCEQWVEPTEGAS